MTVLHQDIGDSVGGVGGDTSPCGGASQRANRGTFARMGDSRGVVPRFLRVGRTHSRGLASEVRFYDCVRPADSGAHAGEYQYL